MESNNVLGVQTALGAPNEQISSSVVMEDYLEKQGSRAKNFWHERYFKLTADGNLRYYNKKDDNKAKATLDLNKLRDCEVSELFVAKQKGQLMYCVKVTWAVELGDSFSDNDSAYSGNGGTVAMPLGDETDDVQMETPLAEDSKKKRNIFRKSKSKKQGSTVNTKVVSPANREEGNKTPNWNNINAGSGRKPIITLRRNSFDGETLTVSPRQQRTPASARSLSDFDEIPKIPSMVELPGDPRGIEPSTGEKHQQQQEHDDDQTVTTRNVSSSNHRRPSEPQLDSEMEYLHSKFLSNERENKRKTKQKIADGAKFAAAAGAAVGVAVVTMGVGLVAGLVAVSLGAAAGASGTAAGPFLKKKQDGLIVMASSDYDRMRRWKACLDASLNSGVIKNSKWGQVFVGEKNRTTLLFPKGSHPFQIRGANTDTVGASFQAPNATTGGPQFFGSTAKWKPLDGGWTTLLGTGSQGLRIFMEERPQTEDSLRRQMLRSLSVDGRPCSPMKSHIVLNSAPLDAFLCLMSQGQLADDGTLSPNSGQRSSFRIIESIDDNTDVIHLVFNPLYLFPSWTTPRDFVLYRYWRLEEDGSFVICYDSVLHKDCPPHPNFCRGEMHQVYTIAPLKKSVKRRTLTKEQAYECLMTAVVQVDPRGWVPIAPIQFFSNQGYGDAFAIAALMQLLDIRDSIDLDRFIPVSLDDASPRATLPRSTMVDSKLADNIPRIESMGSDDPSYHDDLVNYDFTFSNREAVRNQQSPTGLASNPPCLDISSWAEPDANSFRVRGKFYKQDRQKVNAGSSIARLVTVDVVQVDKPIYSGFSVHPTERVQLALKKEKTLKKQSESDLPPFLFVVNIVLPGPPFYHGVFYYAIDRMSSIDGSDGTPSSLLCNQFFFGESDAFRDKTFKLIPQIVEGNFIVRKAVGSTPAIMGKKLKQIYVRTDRTFEVVLDCGSSPVATGVIRLSLGYAKSLVVDMGFLFEGDDEDHLPERLMGCVRIRNLEYGPQLRFVRCPQVEESVPRAIPTTTPEK